jgi:hypothetical protein
MGKNNSNLKGQRLHVSIVSIATIEKGEYQKKFMFIFEEN